MMLSAQKQFTDFITGNKLFKRNDKILLGVSGGKDSVLMAILFASAGYNFAIAHCNFNLRGDESLRDENFVRDLANRLKVPFYLQSFDTESFAKAHKISIQMAARELRYNFFRELKISESFDKIAIAQHQNDAIETVLINLIRGTGIAGLHGIKSTRDDIIRPLMCFTADEISDIVRKNNIQYVEDSSNLSNKYMRNKLRLDIIPQMKKLNPALGQTFKQNIAYFSQLEELLAEQTNKLRKSIFIEKDGIVSIRIEDILNLHPQQLLLFELLKVYGFNATQIENLIVCLNGKPGRQFFGNGYLLTVDRTTIEISPRTGGSSASEKSLPGLGDYHFGNNRLSVTETEKIPMILSDKNKVYVDSKKLIFPLKLRYWQQGDVFKPFGMKGFKKLSDYFIHQKIPLHQKTQIPILVNGNGEIIWICGYRNDDRYKVDLNSKKIIIFELHK